MQVNIRSVQRPFSPGEAANLPPLFKWLNLSSPSGRAELSSMEVLQLPGWSASSLLEPISTDSEEKEWPEASWEKY